LHASCDVSACRNIAPNKWIMCRWAGAKTRR
jgi:hypothetical protein